MKNRSVKLWKQLLVLILVVMMLPVYTVSAETNSLQLGEQMKAKIQVDYLEIHKTANPDSADIQKMTADDILVLDYYGNYNGYEIVQIFFKDVKMVFGEKTIKISHYEFVFNESTAPYFFAYKESEFIPVRDAYEQGLLSADDVRGIAVAFGAIDLWECPFDDVKKEDWYYEYIKYAYSNNLFLGLTENTFGPDEEMTRAMLTTVLWRYAGSPAGYENAFDDVQDGVWYTEAVSWAAANEIVYGMSENTFAPDETVTREQITAILHRYAKLLTGEELKPEFELKGFDDLNEISDWAYESMNWAQAYGLIYGRGINDRFCLAPVATATRAEVAAFLMRFVEYIE